MILQGLRLRCLLRRVHFPKSFILWHCTHEPENDHCFLVKIPLFFFNKHSSRKGSVRRRLTFF